MNCVRTRIAPVTRIASHECGRESRGASAASRCAAAGRPAAPRRRRAAARKAKLRPLMLLVPYIWRYRGRAVAAVCALVLAALATLAVPIAVRRMIDFGFTSEGVNLIDSYFSVMIGVVAVLALASASRFYLVTTLGERIVADLRGEVFGHLTSLSSAFFDEAKTGEMVSRLTADTTQIKAAVGSSVSVALRNLVLFLGASIMMVVTSPRLSGFVLVAIPLIVLPLYGFGRAVRQRSRLAQDTLADASAYVSELIGAVRVLQAFTNEALAIGRFARGGRARLPGRRLLDPGARHPHRHRDLSGVRQRGGGAVGRCPGRARRHHHAGPAVAVPAVRGAGGQRPGRAVPGRRRGRGGLGGGRAPVRDPGDQAGDRAAGASGRAAGAGARRGGIRIASVSPIRRGRTFACSTASRFGCSAARRSRSSALRAPARARSSTSCCGSTIRRPAPSRSTACALTEADPFALRQRIALVPQDAVVFGGLDRREHPVRAPAGERRRGGARGRSRARHRVHRAGCRRASRRRSASAA